MLSIYENSTPWQTAIAGYPNQIDNHYLSQKLVQFALHTEFIFPKIASNEPILGTLTIFSVGSSKGKAGFWSKSQCKVILASETSAQRAEIQGVILVLEEHKQVPFNLISDNQYVVQLTKHIETAILGSVSDEELFHLFTQLQSLVQAHTVPFFIGHIHSHSGLPGPVTKGNEMVDQLIFTLQEATHSHQQFHQNSQSLRK